MGLIAWVSLVANNKCPVVSCCNSAVAFLRLNLLKSEDFLLIFSSLLALQRDFPSPLLRASLIANGSLLLPPVLIDVDSRAAARRVIVSPPEIRSWRT